ncbi:MAG TPA: dihydroxyacetone kinase subunit DhaL [Bacillota bacterium]|nr:dihydroxyacetone kinase subunit DhaL [Bacillota bacterium]
MSTTVTEIKEAVSRLCDIIIANEIPFCELDSAAGDGDFGMSLAKGFRQVKNQLEELDLTSIHKFLRGCSMILLEYCGGASGPIWGSGFGAAAGAAKGKESLEPADVALMFEEAAAVIQKRGGAAPGDKTLLDALIPAAAALSAAAAAGKSMTESFREASAAADAGAEATKTMIAKKGRATYVGERSLNHPDAGAAAIAIIMKELLK